MHNATPEIAARYRLRKSGSRFIGACPKCGGSEQTDRFVLFADAGFKCFSCDWKGDRIKWLREMEGMSCKEAHDHEGTGCSVSCPHYGPCRNGELVQRRTRSVAAPPALFASGVATVNPSHLSDKWLAWSNQLATKAQAALAHEPEHIAWLAARGVDAAAIDRHGLGWLSHDQRIDRASIGLTQERDGKTKLWIPAGLVIPIPGRSGRIEQIRIRRTPEARERFLPTRKYNEIEGGGKDPLFIGPLTGHRGVVVVEAELDAIAVAAAHGGVLVLALRSVGNGLPDWLRAICAAAPIILVALDADAATDGKDGAGPKAVRRWQATFSQARFWPVPSGKDPGDYVKDHGGNLHAWVEAGLPPVVVPTVAQYKNGATVSAPIQDASFPPDCSRRGVGGESQDGVEDNYKVLTLTDGTEICLTSDQATWSRLAASGEIVFSDHELSRLQQSLVGLDEEERTQAVRLVVDSKRIFPGAYVRRGEVVA